MSYDGHLGWGLLGDYDALPDLETIASDLESAIASLSRAAGLEPGVKRRARTAAPPRAARRARAGVSANGRAASKRAGASS
jgi:hypothetical protein